MSAEILKPFGDYFTPGVNKEVVELLESALELARRGECVAIGLVMISPGGFTKTRGVRGSRGFGEIVGGAAVLQHDLIRSWKED